MVAVPAVDGAWRPEIDQSWEWADLEREDKGVVVEKYAVFLPPSTFLESSPLTDDMMKCPQFTELCPTGEDSKGIGKNIRDLPRDACRCLARARIEGKIIFQSFPLIVMRRTIQMSIARPR